MGEEASVGDVPMGRPPCGGLWAACTLATLPSLTLHLQQALLGCGVQNGGLLFLGRICLANLPHTCIISICVTTSATDSECIDS